MPTPDLWLRHSALKKREEGKLKKWPTKLKKKRAGKSRRAQYSESIASTKLLRLQQACTLSFRNPTSLHFFACQRKKKNKTKKEQRHRTKTYNDEIPKEKKKIFHFVPIYLHLQTFFTQSSTTTRTFFGDPLQTDLKINSRTWQTYKTTAAATTTTTAKKFAN